MDVDDKRQPVDAALFASYAGDDPVRWREATGARVLPHDERRGDGRIVQVRWGTAQPSAGAGVLIRLYYRSGLTGTTTSRSFARVVEVVHLPVELARLIAQAAAAGSGDREAAGRLEARAEQLRRRHDDEMAARAQALREAAARRR